MSRVRNKNTQPELIVRSELHNMGFRFRLHSGKLPGKPDIILPKYKKIIFVHGCFWHGHPGCPRAKRPTTNKKFWDKKLNENKKRDKLVIAELERIGWTVLVVWSCEVKNIVKLRDRLLSFLNADAE